ncbi:MAG: hydantoinase/oxoprolinase family protein [Anaerolineales bacterium]
MRVGIDTGGTFTDFVAFDPQTRKIETFKVLSTPDDPARAILDGLARIAGTGQRALVHGSTVATNALLERKGARVALINTAGFRDLLQIGRQERPALYDLFADPPDPLVPRQHRLEVTERVNHRGEVQTPLDESTLDALVQHCREHAIESIAICLLFSFANPAHEQMVAAKFAAAGFMVSASHQVLPEFREYERASTTTINAYVSPVMSGYLDRLEAALPGDRFRVMQSNGGMVSPQLAGEQAVRCILSGPAGGLVGAQAVARAAGFERILTFDMGGTSTDVALLDGEAPLSASSHIGGLPVGVPMLAIHTVGSGGGSIAFRDAGGGLQVGPQSAGANPGPACYGAGDLPTVTDANLLLGRIRPDQFFGGRMQLDPARARRAFEVLSTDLSLAPETCHSGTIQIVNAHMVRALRVISVEKGRDPRDFTLMAFGGAGGLHAVDLARELGMPRVLVPRQAATLSALGMLLADAIRDYSRTVMLPGDTPFADLETAIAPLVEQGRSDLSAEGFSAERVRIEAKADLRYAGQSFELSVPFSHSFVAAFHEAHQATYGYHDPHAEIEIVNLRVRAIGTVEQPPLPTFPKTSNKLDRALLGHFPLRLDDEQKTAPFYDGDKLGVGHVVEGPAIVVRPDTTVLVGEGDYAEADRFLNLLITIGST